MVLTVELLGQARRLAQTKRSLVEIHDRATLREVMACLATRFPTLVGPVIVPGTYDLASPYMLNIDGRRVAKDFDAPAQDGQRLLLMFVEAGG